MNEPRHQGLGDDLTSTTLRSWVDRVGRLIKTLDPNHLISSGIEGHGARYGFGGDEGNDFLVIHASPFVDFCSAHPYPTESVRGVDVEMLNAYMPHEKSVLKREREERNKNRGSGRQRVIDE